MLPLKTWFFKTGSCAGRIFWWNFEKCEQCVRATSVQLYEVVVTTRRVTFFVCSFSGTMRLLDCLDMSYPDFADLPSICGFPGIPEIPWTLVVGSRTLENWLCPPLTSSRASEPSNPVCSCSYICVV